YMAFQDGRPLGSLAGTANFRTTASGRVLVADHWILKPKLGKELIQPLGVGSRFPSRVPSQQLRDEGSGLCRGPRARLGRMDGRIRVVRTVGRLSLASLVVILASSHRKLCRGIVVARRSLGCEHEHHVAAIGQFD